MDPLVPGSLYELTYVLQSGNYQWYQWKMTAVFLDHQKKEFTDDCIFSLRPQVGSTTLRTNCIMDVKLIQKDAGARDVKEHQIKRPKRLPGSVPGPSMINQREILFQEREEVA